MRNFIKKIAGAILGMTLLLAPLSPSWAGTTIYQNEIYQVPGLSSGTDIIYGVAVDDGGKIWSASTNNILGELMDDGSWKTFSIPYGSDAINSGESFVFLPKTSELALAFGTSYTVRKYNIASNSWTDIGRPTGTKVPIDLLRTDPTGNLVALVAGHIYRYSGTGTTWTDISTGFWAMNMTPAPSNINDFAFDSTGNLWVVTYNGVYSNVSGTWKVIKAYNQAYNWIPSSIGIDTKSGRVVWSMYSSDGSYAPWLVEYVSGGFKNYYPPHNGNTQFGKPFFGPNGELYVCQDKDTYLYSKSSDTWSKIQSGFKNSSYVFDTNGYLWYGYGAYVNRLLSPPDVPTTISAMKTTTSSTVLTWSPVPRAITYNLYQNGSLIGSNLSTTSTTISNLAPNTTYSFSVQAVNAQGQSLKSDPLSITTSPAVPTNLAVGNGSSTSVTLSWSGTAGATQYMVYQNGSKIATVNGGTSYNVTGLSAGSINTFAISASNGTSESESTQEVTYMSPSAPPPLVTMTINNGSAQTTSKSLTLDIKAASSVYDAAQLKTSISNDGLTWSTPSTYTPSVTWTLPNTASTGSYPVFVRVTDPSGGSAIAYASTYYVDATTSPNVGGTPTTGGTVGGIYPTITYNGISNVYVTSNNQVSLDLALTGGAYASISTDNVSFSSLFSTGTPYSLSLPAGDGLKTVYVRLASKNDSNALGVTGKVYFLVDSTAPVLTTVKGVNGATATSGTTYMVQVDVQDNTTPTSGLQYQIDSGAWLPLPANGQISITGFAAHSGQKTVRITVQDFAGNKATKSVSFWTI